MERLKAYLIVNLKKFTKRPKMEIYILTLFAFAISGTVIGNAIHKKFKSKRLYFEQIYSLVGTLKSDLSFRQSKIESVISAYSETVGEELKVHCNEFILSISDGKLFLSKFGFSNDEYVLICDFFTALGSVDLDTQIDQLNFYESRFFAVIKRVKEREEKYGKPAAKLGLMAGLTVGILIL